MAELVGIVDTGVFCCWLEVPGKETAGTPPDLWNIHRAREAIEEVIEQRGTLVLTNSVILEVGRLISQAPNSRRAKAEQLLNRTIESLDGTSPWRRFQENERLWTKQWYEEARAEWPDWADRRVSLTDFSLLWAVRYFKSIGIEAKLVTTEVALETQAQAIAVLPPRGRRRRR